jgi:hypothetical protein
VNDYFSPQLLKGKSFKKLSKAELSDLNQTVTSSYVALA